MTMLEALLTLGAFGALVVAVAIIIWRGQRRDADDTSNKARGGGGASHYDGP